VSAARFQKGDRVRTLFDTGARGLSVLYGLIVHAGEKTARVVWESSLSNVIRQDNSRVTLIAAREAKEADKIGRAHV
jgi:hypothetical protein